MIVHGAASLIRVKTAMRLSIALAVAALPLAACASDRPPGAPTPKAMREISWQEQINESDRKRLAGLYAAWTRSLNQAADSGHRDAVAALADLTLPDAARPGPPPAPGVYRCRTIKMGARTDGGRTAPTAMGTGDFAPCTITAKGSLLWFEQAGGAQRVGGTLYPDGDRMVFLGSKALNGEMGVMAYGSDASRDQVGVLRSFGDARWRLELPWPMWQSNLEIIEILPG
jgi:hypothetical protein